MYTIITAAAVVVLVVVVVVVVAALTECFVLVDLQNALKGALLAYWIQLIRKLSALADTVC